MNKLSRFHTISSLFIKQGINSFEQAINYIHNLPYGRNKDKPNPLNVLSDKCGTCSTKHALIYELAKECQLNFELYMGIFLMDKFNTPKIKNILYHYQLNSIPEMHCYLKYHNEIIDITFPNYHLKLLILEEWKIRTEDIIGLKSQRHKEFVKEWLSNKPQILYNLEEIMVIREKVIAELSKE